MIEPEKKRPGHGWKCPHCQHEMRIRNSSTEHPMMRRYQLQCMNIDCSATFTATMEIIRQMSPSGTPNKDIVTAMEELNRRWEKHSINNPEKPAQPKIQEKPHFYGVDHMPAKRPLPLLTLKKDATP